MRAAAGPGHPLDLLGRIALEDLVLPLRIALNRAGRCARRVRAWHSAAAH